MKFVPKTFVADHSLSSCQIVKKTNGCDIPAGRSR
jgi:hypothetical protein